MRRWFLVAVLGVLTLVVGVLGVRGVVAGVAATSGGAAVSEAAPPAVSVTPTAGASDVAPTTPATVAVADGRLVAAALTDADGTPVAGRPGPEGRSWTTTAPLAYGTTYRWTGTAIGDDGRPTPLTGSFDTVDPDTITSATINIADGETVGVAAPVVVQFDEEIPDKAAAEREMSVRTSVPTEGAWAWLPDGPEGSRAHWRPREYWTPGTQVEVAVRQFGVDDGDGVWGDEDLTSHFTIGRSQVVTADVATHRMRVVRDGREVMDFPASFGLESDPGRHTSNGVHVVMSKSETVLMSNPEYGYENVPEHWAVRISNNGEFIHANPDTVGVQGSDNVSHGCVNLSTADAEEYFGTALFGDPVEVTGSETPLDASDGDIYDWTLSWSEWTSMSALKA